MAGKKKDIIEGQLTLAMCMDTDKYIVQSNELINAKQTLSLNANKLIKLAIMQVKPDDEEFSPYVFHIPVLADTLGISSSNVYRDIENLCNEILENPVKFKRTNINKKTGRKDIKWAGIPWVKRCEYDTGTGYGYIKLNDELKPFLLGLKKYYTQYVGDDLMAMKSNYSARVLEILLSKINIKIIPREGIHVILDVEELKESLDVESKYTKFGNFRQKVLDVAVNEINKATHYTISYEYIKEKNKVVSLNFLVVMDYIKFLELPQKIVDERKKKFDKKMNF